MTDKFKYWRLCLWGGPVFGLALLVCWALFARIIPPLPATASAAEIAEFFLSHKNGIRAGMVGSMTFAPFYLLWGLGITRIMETLEGENRILSVLQLWGAGMNVVTFVFGFCVLLFGAYRPESLSPEILQLIYDSFWIAALVTFYAAFISQICIGVLFLGDRREVPLFPAWVCWYSIWAAAMAVLENLMPFFKSGPFARSGALNFWIELNVFFLWLVFTTVYSFKAVTRLENEQRGT